MHFVWTLVFYFIFGIVGGILLISAKVSDSRKGQIRLVVPGIICVIIAAVSMVLFVLAVLIGEETGRREKLGTKTDIIFMEQSSPNSEDEYYTTVGDQYVYMYYDENEKLQTGYADIEDSKEYTGHLNGRACILITTTKYNAEFQWWYFVGAYHTVTEKTYEFYTP